MDQEEAAERAELISRMFALVTAKLEDGATIAAESQRRLPTEELRASAAKLRGLAHEIMTIADGIGSLVS